MSIDNLAIEAFDIELDIIRPLETPHDTDLAVFASVQSAAIDRLKRAGEAMTNIARSESEARR